MDIYETLRYITKKALPKIKYDWDTWSLDNCDGVMYWDGEWECTNCGEIIDSDEDDNDGIIEC